MTQSYQDFTGGPLFGDAARVHHGNALGHLRNDAQIVGDEKQTESQFTSEAVQQIQDLFCTVTSSAVVGSSAISSRGPAASAMAIMTRCRRPPESWCGNCSARISGSGTAARRKASIVLRSLRWHAVAADARVSLLQSVRRRA